MSNQISELDGFDDGYTHEFSYERIPGLRGDNKGAFRPATYTQREQILHKIKTTQGGDPVAKIMCAVVANHIKSWTLTYVCSKTKEKKPLPITLDALLNMTQSSHVDKLFNIVVGAEPSGPANVVDAMPSPDQSYIEQLTGTNPTLGALQGN